MDAQVAGGRLGSRCPQRGQRGHGSWYLSLELPAGHRRRIRRGGFPTREAATAASRHADTPGRNETAMTA